MGQVLHKRATTTQATRRAIQDSEESQATLAKRYGINIKTVAKWKKRSVVEDLPMGAPKRSVSLSREEEAAVVLFRARTLLPLDDCLYALQERIPHLSRSVLHRCFQRAGISRLPQEKSLREKKKFKSYPPGFFHIDIAEVRTEEGKLYLFVGIDRTTKFAYARLYQKATRHESRSFLSELIASVPYKIKVILTDNGIQFAFRPQDRHTWTHPFTADCRDADIDHRRTQVKHPWTNGQVERMNRTLKEATVKRYHYESTMALNRHLIAFLDAYNYGKRLKMLRGLTPYQEILRWKEKEPAIFQDNLNHFHMGPNN